MKGESVFIGIIAAFIVAYVVFALVKVLKLRHVFVVQEGFSALLYHHGKFVGELAPGRYVRWGRNYAIQPFDRRSSTLEIGGQEALTADNIPIKLTLIVTYVVTNPAKAAHETQNWYSQLYHAAQLAIRQVLSAVPVETLLMQRGDFGSQLLALVQPAAASIGIDAKSVEVKDIILPGDLKRAYAETLKAKQEGLAALERARGESAALRNLANAARVLEGNPALMNLRMLQSLTSVQNSGNTIVFGMPGGFVPLTAQAFSSAPGDGKSQPE